jgi:hypothetical protein
VEGANLKTGTKLAPKNSILYLKTYNVKKPNIFMSSNGMFSSMTLLPYTAEV